MVVCRHCLLLLADCRQPPLLQFRGGAPSTSPTGFSVCPHLLPHFPVVARAASLAPVFLSGGRTRAPGLNTRRGLPADLKPLIGAKRGQLLQRLRADLKPLIGAKRGRPLQWKSLLLSFKSLFSVRWGVVIPFLFDPMPQEKRE